MIKLPWPPSVNHYWILIKAKQGGRKVLGPKGREFRTKVAEYIKNHNLDGYFTEHDRLEMVINMYPPDRRKRDVDNINKPTLDALEGAGFFPDDCQIDDLRTIRRSPVKGGRLDIEVYRI